MYIHAVYSNYDNNTCHIHSILLHHKLSYLINQMQLGSTGRISTLHVGLDNMVQAQQGLYRKYRTGKKAF